MPKLTIDVPADRFEYVSKAETTHSFLWSKLNNAVLVETLFNGARQKAGDSVSAVQKDKPETWGDFEKQPDGFKSAVGARINELFANLAKGVWSLGGGGPRIPEIDSFRRAVLSEIAVRDAGMKKADATALFAKRKPSDDWQVAALVFARIMAAQPDESRKPETIHRALLNDRPHVDDLWAAFIEGEAQKRLDESKAAAARTTITADAMKAMLAKRQPKAA